MATFFTQQIFPCGYSRYCRRKSFGPKGHLLENYHPKMNAFKTADRAIVN